MAHEIYKLANGKDSMGYVGQVPWHGLGQEIPEDTPLEKWPEMAGLDWEIEKRPLFAKGKDGLGNPVEFVDRVALIRSDDELPLSIMSKDYKIVQPIEILEFYRNLIDTAGFKMHTAGSLFHGRKIWALASIGKDVTIKGDKMEGYLLLSTSYDGSMATTAQFTSVRVVCNNTLSVAVDSVNNRYAVKVPHHSMFNAEQVKEELGLANDAWSQFSDQVAMMIDTKIRRREAVMMLIRAIGDPKVSIEDQPNVRTIAKIMNLFDGAGIGAGMESAKGTAFGLLNAVTQWADHDRPTRTQSSRLDSAWFGRWEGLKKNVFRICSEVAQKAL